jgi:hypothetical protein
MHDGVLETKRIQDISQKLIDFSQSGMMRQYPVILGYIPQLYKPTNII